jgi:hypothetical protein
LQTREKGAFKKPAVEFSPTIRSRRWDSRRTREKLASGFIQKRKDAEESQLANLFCERQVERFLRACGAQKLG